MVENSTDGGSDAGAGPGPLDGVRVLDLTAMLAGPFATMLLADLGADVVKIEPSRGDITRGVGPQRPGDGPGSLGGYFQSINRGKRSVVLDLKHGSGREHLLQLVDGADVLVENFSAGVMERLGLSYETLAARNPRLVYAALRGFGDHRTGDSPYRDWPALDIVAQAVGGFLSVTGTGDGEPVKSGVGIGDLFPGVLLSLGIVSALRHVDRTGEGQFLDVAMYDAVLALCERIVYQYSYTGEAPRPLGNTHPLLSPFDILATADGWVAVAAPHDRHWAVIAQEIGRPGLAVDPDFATNVARTAHRKQVRDLLEKWCGERTTASVVATFGGRVPIGPVNDAASIFADPHVAARRMLVSLEQPSGDPVVVAGSPIKMTRSRVAPRGRAPLLGESPVDVVLGQWSR